MTIGRTALRGPARVLVVGEEPTASLIRLALNHGVYVVRIASTREDALTVMRDWGPHLAVIDIDIEGRAGMDLLGQLRVNSSRLPVVVITQRGEIRTKLAAFERGADDFLTAPFSPEELVARVLAIMRRTYGDSVPFIPVIRVGDLAIDLLNQRVHVGKSKLRLSDLEQSLLYLLASHPGRVLTRELILDTLWGTDYVAESNVVDRHVRNLRVKLKDDWRHPKFIGTVPGQGYRFLIETTPGS